MDEILQELKAEIVKLKGERDLWHARALAMFWRLPDDLKVSELREETERALSFIRK